MIPPRRSGRTRIWIILGVILLLSCITSSTFATFYTDFLWFKSLNYAEIFTTRLTTTIELTFIATLFALAFLLANWSFLPHLIAPQEFFW